MLRAKWSEHRHVWVIALAFILLSLLFSFWGSNKIHPTHPAGWFQADDLWGYFRSAENVSWGWLGGIYAQGTGTVTLPGVIFLLTPVAFIAYHLHLSTGYPFPVPKPTAWLIMYPYVLLFVTLPLVALDSVSRALGVDGRRRVWLTIGQAVLIWQLVAWWGHVEDAIAVSFLLWAVLALRKGNTVSAGWMLAISLCFQPLTILAAPLLWSQTPSGKRLAFTLRSVMPPLLLALLMLVTNPKRAGQAFFHQLNYPSIDHATPWVYVIDPHIRLREIIHSTRPVLSHGRWTIIHVSSIGGPAVSAGPMRLIMVLIAAALGLYLYRKKISLNLSGTVLLLVLLFAMRCVLEPVMVSFYLWPYMALAFLLVVAGWEGHRRQILSFVLLLLQIMFAYEQLNPWLWYGIQLAIMTSVIYLGWPRAKGANDGEESPLLDSSHLSTPTPMV